MLTLERVPRYAPLLRHTLMSPSRAQREVADEDTQRDEAGDSAQRALERTCLPPRADGSAARCATRYLSGRALSRRAV